MSDLALNDAFATALEMARGLTSSPAVVGYGVIELRGEDDVLKLAQPFANLITDVGDLFLASKAIQGIAPAAAGAPTAITGMKLGTGTTAATKNSTAAALITYLSGSQALFDSTYPQTANLGAGLGVNAVFKTTWAAGTASNGAITEAVIVNDAATNATSTAANTYARVVFSAINKTSADSLAITWNWKFLGA